jgi:hypothetical protein
MGDLLGDPSHCVKLNQFSSRRATASTRRRWGLGLRFVLGALFRQRTIKLEGVGNGRAIHPVSRDGVAPIEEAPQDRPQADARQRETLASC